MGNQRLQQLDKEQLIIEAFRRMSDECQMDALTTMQAWAKAFPRRPPALLSLVPSSSVSTGRE